MNLLKAHPLNDIRKEEFMKHLRLCSLFMTAVLTASALSNGIPVHAEETQSTNAVSAAPVVDVSADDSFGSLVAKDINEQIQFDENCAVLGLYCAGTTAVVNFQTDCDAILVVGLYEDPGSDDSGVKMLAVGQVPVKAGQTDEVVPFSNLSVLPEHYLLRAYLISKNQTLLSKEYVDTSHTTEIEALAASDVNDYDGYTVLNLDDDEKTNFMVYEKDVQILSCDGTKNVVLDENGLTYTIENYTGPTDTGSVVAIQTESDVPAVFRIVNAEKSGTTTIITADENLELTDVFAFIKIEGDSGSYTAEDLEQAAAEQQKTQGRPPLYTLDAENASEAEATDIPYDSSIEYKDNAKDGSVSFSFKFTHGDSVKWARALKSLTAPSEEELKKRAEASRELSFLVQGEAQVSFGYSVMQTSKLSSSDFSIHVDANVKAGIEGHAELLIPLPTRLPISVKSKNLNINMGFYFFIEVEGSVLTGFESELSYTKTNGLQSDFALNWLDVSGKFRLGFGAEVKLKAGELIDVGVDVRVGSGAEAALAEKHESCAICLSFTPIFEVTAEMDFDILGIFKKKKNNDKSKEKKSFFDSEVGAAYKHEFGKYYLSSTYGLGEGTCPGLTGSSGSEGEASGTDDPQGESVVANNELGFKLDKETDTYIVYSYSKYNVDIVIPATHEGKPVTKIDEQGFAGCKHLKSVEIPSSVTEIGESAFWHCDRLESVTLPDSITKIPNSCFVGCSALKSIVIPSSVTTIGGSAFASCWNLEEVDFGSGLKELGTAAFYGCKNLSNVNINAPLEKIGFHAFAETGAETVSITSSKIVDYLDSTFYNCRKLQSVALNFEIAEKPVSPHSPDKDGSFKEVFSVCPSLRFVTLPAGLKVIGDHSFSWCTSLKNITIPDTVERIGQGAFFNCISIEKLYIPDNVQVIEKAAFMTEYNDRVKLHSNLKSVRLPSGLQEISAQTFESCDSLAAVQMPKNLKKIGSYAFHNCIQLHRLDIPDSVEVFDDYALDWCAKTVYYLPKNVREIGKYAVQHCSWLPYYIDESNRYIQGIILPASLEKYNTTALKGENLIVMNPNLEFVNEDDSQYYLKDGIIYGYSGSTAEAFVNAYKDQYKISFVAIDGMELSTEPKKTTTSTTPTTPETPETPPELDEPQTITFKDLKPDTLYNFYDLVDDKFSAENLLYLSQGMSDSNGVLTIWYRPIKDDSKAKKYVKCYTKIYGAGLGDLNGDNHIDVSDAVLLARFCAEDSTAKISTDGMRNADVNDDGKKDANDVTQILRYIARLIEAF